MSLWDRDRKLVVGVAVTVAVAVAVHLIAAKPRRDESGRIEKEENAPLRAEIASLNQEAGLAVPAAIDALGNRRKELDGVLKGLDRVLLQIPDGSRFRVPLNRLRDEKFYFQEQQNKLYEERCAGGQYPAKGVLGFTQDMYDAETAELLLERLAVVDRLTMAVNQAGVAQVKQISHRKTQIRTARGVKDAYLELLPVAVEIVADEHALVEFLTEISREGSYLALDSLDVQVADVKSRTVSVSAELSALLLRRKAPPRSSGQPGVRGPAVGRY